MITLFTTPKDFTGIFKVIQTNALNSWRVISHDIQIIIMGNSDGSKDAAQLINAEHIQDIKCSPEGTPLLNDLFDIAQKRARYNILAYVNADIILPPNLLREIDHLDNKFNKFLMVGHRWDLDVDKFIDFKTEVERKIFWSAIEENSKKHECTGIDYFIFRKGMYPKLPEFVVGRWGWDNWLIWKARRCMVPVIDCSKNIIAIHQNHGYKYHNISSIEDSKKGSEAKHNIQLIKNRQLNILDSTHLLSGNKIIKKRDKESKKRYLHRLEKVFPEFSILIKIYRRFYKRFIL